MVLGFLLRIVAVAIGNSIWQSTAIPIDNGVITSSVECMEDTIIVTFNTKNPFHGRIFVKGMSDKAECSKSYTSTESQGGDKSLQNPTIKFSFGTCNMHKARMAAPQPGMMQSLVTIISFHKLFITKIDKAYKVQCFYMEAENIVTSNFEVSMLSTDEVRDAGRMPVCTYQVRRESRSGAIVKYAKVGEPVYHTWECDGSTHKVLVKNCFVDDGQGTRYQILDDKGCAIDKYILPGIQYDNENPGKAWVEAHVFKYADKPTVYFQCAVHVCNKDEQSCEGITPPKCPTPASPSATSPNQTSISSNKPAAAPAVNPPHFQSSFFEYSDRRRRDAMMSILQPVKGRSTGKSARPVGSSHAEVDLISDAITVIEIDDTSTLKNGQNNNPSENIPANKPPDYLFNSDQSSDKPTSANNFNSDKIVCMSATTLGVLVAFVVFIFLTTSIVSLILCKLGMNHKRHFYRKRQCSKVAHGRKISQSSSDGTKS